LYRSSFEVANPDGVLFCNGLHRGRVVGNPSVELLSKDTLLVELGFRNVDLVCWSCQRNVLRAVNARHADRSPIRDTMADATQEFWHLVCPEVGRQHGTGLPMCIKLMSQASRQLSPEVCGFARRLMAKSSNRVRSCNFSTRMANNSSGDNVKTPKEIYKRDLQSRAKWLAVFRSADFLLVGNSV